jgi:hypothetical protein
MRVPAVLLSLVAITSCSETLESRDAPEPSESPCAPSVTIAVEPVKAGDVNTMWIQASVTSTAGRIAGESVSFYLTRGGSRFREALDAPLTDARGSTLLDVGGQLAISESKREAVRDADVLIVEYGGRSATPDRAKLCQGRRQVEFRPADRSYRPATTNVSSRAQLLAKLQAVEDELQSNVGPYRMPDGESPCRLLVALMADVKAHPDWFGPAAVQDALRRMKEESFSCIAAPMLAAIDVDRIIDDLTQR